MAARIASVRHKRLVPVFDQGNLGSCTGNAAAGAVSTEPFTNQLTEKDAVAIYGEATHLDKYRGVYPPTDTGSSGLAVAKALKKRNLISGYSWGFGLDAVLRALVLAPCITGIAWLDGCDDPDSRGLVHYRGELRGGHEIMLDEIDVPNKLVWFTNSWGSGWGVDGRFCMTWDDYKRALADHGDATFLHPPA
jgi:hypothetical protein